MVFLIDKTPRLCFQNLMFIIALRALKAIGYQRVCVCMCVCALSRAGVPVASEIFGVLRESGCQVACPFERFCRESG